MDEPLWDIGPVEDVRPVTEVEIVYIHPWDGELQVTRGKVLGVGEIGHDSRWATVAILCTDPVYSGCVDSIPVAWITSWTVVTR